MRGKKGVSPVIATVLLLILTIVIVSILAVFVVPFVKKSIEGSEECFDVLGDIKFDETIYNCYYSDQASLKNRSGFSVRIENDDIVGFKATLFSQGTANSHDVQNGTIASDIRMLDQDFKFPLEVPKKGGVRTYVANGTFERVDILPILRSGKTCDEIDSIELESCIDNGAIKAITKY